MIGVRYEFATIVSQLPLRRRVDAMLLLDLRSMLSTSFQL